MLDYLLYNARLIDPAGGTDRPGALGISAGRIAGIYPDGVAAPPAATTMDLGGCVLTSGFIDLHAHADVIAISDDYADPTISHNTDCDASIARREVLQGVTTTYSGNCGFSPFHPEAWMEAMAARGSAVNHLTQIGHGALRFAVGLTDNHAAANPEQIAAMDVLAQKSFAAGVAGLSFGLQYQPGASEEEVWALASAAAGAGRPVSIHTRTVGLTTRQSVEQPCRMARETGARVLISHLVYQYVGAALDEAVAIIRAWRARGADVWVDSGVYTDWATFAGSPIFEDEAFAEAGYRYEDITAIGGSLDGQVMGTRERFLVARGEAGVLFIVRCGQPDDIARAYGLEDVMVTSDIGPGEFGAGHPQGAATFVKFLREQVRGDGVGGAGGAAENGGGAAGGGVAGGGVGAAGCGRGEAGTGGGGEGAAARSGGLSLVEGLRRVSYLPAKALGLFNKGRLQVGADADLVAFDLEQVRPVADFSHRGNPVAPPEGVRAVFVNGVLAVHNGKLRCETAGKIIRVGGNP
ncbi:MAG: amidohydrolase family protein [Actinomycetes bacterium]|jgi:N-acyl-D-amino-acid deacylase|nr:amidohydrolase family protein [Actinomycetes bacterium]